MMNLIRQGFTRAFLAALVLLSAVDAGAQPFDHLECYKIKDPAAKVKYTADLLPEQTQFLAQTGCQLKVPAKLFCVDVAKSNVAPPPPAVLNGQNTRDYLCYNLKCPKLGLTLPVEDQFGTRTITVKNPAQLCAPARKIGFPDPATPTPCLPPATPTPTATPAAPTCTDLMQNGGETDVDCGGPCPPCPLGDGCGSGSDCQSGICSGGMCTFCSPGQQQSCSTMLPGPCALGLQTCQAGGNAYGPCVGPSPQTEICNAVDDNCDGIVDNACPSVPNASGSCVGPGCSYVCGPGYSDCDGNFLADGCEVNVATDVSNCGGCASVCSSNHGSPTCTAGTCIIICDPDFADCNNNARTDGCEANTTSNNNNCGACGIMCTGGQTCINSVCQ